MVNQIRPLARLFRAMADLIDRDHTSQTRYEAIAKAAGVVAARAPAEGVVGGGRGGTVRGGAPRGRASRFPGGLAAPTSHRRSCPGHAAVGAGARWRPAAA